MTIEKAYTEFAEYVDAAGISWPGFSEDETKEKARAAMMAVVEFVCPFPPKVCARYAKQSVIHSLHQVALERIQALCAPQEPPGEEG